MGTTDAMGRFHIEGLPPGDYKAFSWEDIETGAWQDPDFIRNRLFRPFDSTKGSGYGIGVYESQEYAKSLGGRLEVVSHPGQGTIMRMCLPRLPSK